MGNKFSHIHAIGILKFKLFYDLLDILLREIKYYKQSVTKKNCIKSNILINYF